jgi:hypothetical protein
VQIATTSAAQSVRSAKASAERFGATLRSAEAFALHESGNGTSRTVAFAINMGMGGK